MKFFLLLNSKKHANGKKSLKNNNNLCYHSGFNNIKKLLKLIVLHTNSPLQQI